MVSSPQFGTHGAFPRIHQQEAARAVGVLGFAGFEAGLANQRCLLIAQNSGNRDSLRGADFHCPVSFAARADAWQHRFRNAECIQQLLVPGKRVEIHELGAAGIGDVGDVKSAVRAAGEVPG